MGLVLTGGRIVTAVDAYQADVRIVDEQIEQIGRNLAEAADQIIDATGCLLFPGGIDPHTHFALPAGRIVTSDDFASGTKAAVLGGTTTIIDYATQFKGETLREGLANWQLKAGGRSYADYGFHMAITDWTPQIEQEISFLVKNEGISSIKLYLAYKDVLQANDSVILRALAASRECGVLVCLHCENGDLVAELVASALANNQTSVEYHPGTRPIVAEAEATARVLNWAEVSGSSIYIVHLSCQEALEAVVKARLRGISVYAETCPQYLLLDDSRYQENGFDGAKYVISPPLRAARHQAFLWTALAAELIDTVATDHCAFNFRGQKDLGLSDFSKIPNGMPGVETRLSLLYTYGVQTGKISLNQFVALTSTNAAKLFGLFPRKGTIAPGSDADIVVWDPEWDGVISNHRLHHQVDYTPFEGFKQLGRIKHVLLRGQLVVWDGELTCPEPSGVYLARESLCPGKGGRDV